MSASPHDKGAPKSAPGVDDMDDREHQRETDLDFWAYFAFIVLLTVLAIGVLLLVAR